MLACTPRRPRRSRSFRVCLPLYNRARRTEAACQGNVLRRHRPRCCRSNHHGCKLSTMGSRQSNIRHTSLVRFIVAKHMSRFCTLHHFLHLRLRNAISAVSVGTVSVRDIRPGTARQVVGHLTHASIVETGSADFVHRIRVIIMGAIAMLDTCSFLPHSIACVVTVCVLIAKQHRDLLSLLTSVLRCEIMDLVDSFLLEGVFRVLS